MKLVGFLDFLNEMELTEGMSFLVSDIQKISLWFELYHHNTLKHSQHIALGEMHNAFNLIKDDLIEKIMGYTGERYNQLEIGSLLFTEEGLMEFPSQILALGDRLVNFGKARQFSDIENIGQEINGIGAKLKYLLTFNG